MAAFEYRHAEEILGYPDTTQDADLYIEKEPSNCRRLLQGLSDLGFELTEQEAAEIPPGKHFIQLKNGPFDLDLVFAPDGM